MTKKKVPQTAQDQRSQVPAATTMRKITPKRTIPPEKRKRKGIDWEGIGKEYRLDVKSLRVIASQFGVSHVSISKKARKEGWVKDKTSEVRLKTKAGLLVAKKKANKKVTTPTQNEIDDAVHANIEIILGHRKDISKGREITKLLFDQLLDAAEHREEIESDVFKETADDGSNYQRRIRMLKAVTLPAHASTMRDLSQALKNLIPLERRAFNLDESETGDSDLDLKLSDDDKKIFKQAARIISQRVIANATEDD